MKKRIKVILLVLSAILFLMGCTEEESLLKMSKAEEKTEEKKKAVSGETLEVHFIDVGQGDATLIRQSNHSMLIDAGNNSKGTAIQAYLKSQNIEKLDYVIGTHPDADYIGGLDVILYKFDWDIIMMPQVEKDTRTYEDVMKVIEDKNCKITVPTPGDSYNLGEAEFTIVCPQEKDYGENANEYSIGLRLKFGENYFLFTGDAEEASEEDMLESGMDLSADVFKAAHHGSDTANTEAFLKAVSPEAVVISCGEENSYGHPRAAVMNELLQMGVDIYRTDEQGTVVAHSDGKNITWNCGKSESQKAGEPIGTNIEQKEESAYVINTSTRKFHKISCSSVERMKEKNKEYRVEDRAVLIEEGYEPCKVRDFSTKDSY